MSGMPGTDVIQITNLSSAVSSEQMRTLFGFLGDIEEFRLYPPDNAPLSFSSKVCYIKYREPSSVGVAQHLTNTVFIDRALIVVPCAEGKIPEEAKALSLLAPATPVPTLMPGAGLLPIPTQSPVHTPQLSAPLANLAALPATLSMDLGASALSAQPPLMGNVDPSKVDEIRRTVYVGNLNSQTTAAEQLLEFFKQVGDVKFVRMAGDETQPTRFAFVEFANQESVSRALTFNGVMFGDRPLKINHSNNAIVKPPELTPQAAAKELEDVMKRVREAQCTIAAAIEPADTKKRSSSRSGRSRRSRTRSPSRSRSRTHRRRSNSRPRNRASPRSKPRVSDSRSSHGSHRKRSRSSDRRRSRSRSRDSWKKQLEKMKGKEEKKAGKTPLPILKCLKSPQTSHLSSRGHRKRSRNRSRSPRRKARSPSPKRGRKDKRRDRGRESSRERRQRSSSRKKSSWEKERKSERKAKPLKSAKEYKEAEDREIDRDDLATPRQDVPSPCTNHNGSYRAHMEGQRVASADST